MRKLFILMCMIFSISVVAQTNSIAKQQLPNRAVEFIDNWYSNYVGPTYWKEYDYNRVDEYEVRFANGTKIEFDIEGYLKSIDCGRNDYIDKELLPSPIQTYLRRNYANYKVVDYSIDDRGRRWEEHKIYLSNGRYIKFNKLFNVIEIY